MNEARTLWSEKEKCLAEVTARQDTKPGGRGVEGWWVGAGGGGRKASWYYLNSCCVHFPRTEQNWLGKWDIKAVNLANKAALTSTINVTQRRQRLSVPGVFPTPPPHHPPHAAGSEGESSLAVAGLDFSGFTFFQKMFIITLNCRLLKKITHL